MQLIGRSWIAKAVRFENGEADHLLRPLAFRWIVKIGQHDPKAPQYGAQRRRLTGIVKPAPIAPALTPVALTAVRSEIYLVIDPFLDHVAEFTLGLANVQLASLHRAILCGGSGLPVRPTPPARRLHDRWRRD